MAPHRPVTLIGAWPPPTGGVATHMVRLFWLLHHEGWDVSVLGHGDFDTRPPIRHLDLSLGGLAQQLIAVPGGSLVHGHSTLVAYPLRRRLLVLRACRRLKRWRWVETLHDETLAERFAAWPGRVRAAVAGTLADADLIVAATSTIERFVLADLQIAPSKVRQIGTFLPYVGPPASPVAAWREFATSHDPLILAVGAESPLYDFETILKAWPEVKRTWPRAGLEMLVSSFTEDTAYRDHLRVLREDAGPDVRVDRDLPGEDVMGLMEMARVVVRGMRLGAHGLTTAEALIAGTAVVGTLVSDSGAPHNRYVANYAFGDPDALTRAIGRALAGELASQVAEGGAYFRDLAERNAARLLDAYRTIPGW